MCDAISTSSGNSCSSIMTVERAIHIDWKMPQSVKSSDPLSIPPSIARRSGSRGSPMPANPMSPLLFKRWTASSVSS